MQNRYLPLLKKTKSVTFFLAIILLIVFQNASWANVRLPKLVSNHMVLQRGVPLPLWGWADPDEKITITFDNKEYNIITGKDGKWNTQLPPMEAGGPFVMTINGKNMITIRDILIGEVWLASGQSNMEWHLNQNINNFEQEIKNGNYPLIRLFDVNNIPSIIALDTVPSDGWKICSPATVATFSATAYFFGRELYQRYNVPIGLITADWGGTQIEAWISLDSLKKFPEFRKKIESQEATSSLEAFKKRLDEELTLWQQKYTTLDPMYRTTERGRLLADDNPKMKLPALWENSTPELSKFDGVLWLHKNVFIPKSEAGKPITLHLAMVDDVDSTWFNGEKIGGTSPHHARRVYKIPGRLVKAGYNSILVRVLDLIGGGGIYGKPEDLFLKTVNKKISLAGEWSYQMGPDVSNAPDKPVTIFGENSLAALYNSMIHPLAPYAIKGAIWYQGEANVFRSYQYRELFPTMIRCWRNKWGYDFPFLFVQLSAFLHDQEEPADYEWAELREAQTMTLSLPKTGMAVTIDIGNPDNIHPGNKQDVGKRLALAAQKIAYKDDNIVNSGPAYASMTVTGNEVLIKFDNAKTGLLVKDKYGYVKGFAIAGADKKFYWAKGDIKNNEVILTCDKVLKPVAVRYNWGNSPDGNLYNKAGLPAIPFRTDDWHGITFGVTQ